MNLKEPKKKKRMRLQPQPSLPIDPNENGDWRIYTAHLSASGTCIVDPVEMEAVYSMGFFGKGSLSRSFPSFGRRRYGVPPITRNRQWVRRQKWLEELQSLNENNDPEASVDLGRPIVDKSDVNSPTELADDVSSKFTAEASTSEAPSESRESTLNETEQNSEKESGSIPKEPCTKKLKVDEPATPEKAAEIEDDEYEGEIKKRVSRKDESVKLDETNKNDSVEVDQNLRRASSAICGDSVKVDENHENPSSATCDESVQIDESHENASSATHDDSVQIDESHENASSATRDESVQIDENHEKASCVARGDAAKVDEVVLDSTEDEETCEIVERDSKDEQDVYFLNEEDKSDDYFKYGDTSETLMEEETDPYEVLVLPDTDSDTENYLTNVRSRIEKEGFPINETLHLTFEETFFLMYGLGCLQLIHYDGSVFSISNAWNHFQLQDKNFIQKYVVYHYFRSKGWVVKPGLKFGGDFLLYKQGPPFYHASYIVIVEVVDADTLLRDDVKSMRKITWKNLTGLERLSETIAKEILFAQILWPSSIPRTGGQMSVDSLSEFTVRELLWRRWDPKRRRDVVSTDDEDSDST